jgi:hypothetical protein
MRKVTKNIIDVELDDGSTLELEAPCLLETWESPEVKTKVVGDRIVVAYLAHDSDGQNPLSDDGTGQIHHHPSSRYGRRDSDYYSALGLDSYGNIRVDEDAVQEHWRALVEALPDDAFVIEGREDEAADMRQVLANEEAGDYDIEQMVRSALKYKFDLDETDVAELTRRVDMALGGEWDWPCIAEHFAEEGDPDAVLLDLYDHSGVSYSVSGHGMQCRFDTSRGAAVWVPDEYARSELGRRAETYAYAYVDTTGFCKGRNIKYILRVQNTDWTKQSDDWRELYQLAKEIARLKKKAGEPSEFDGRRIATLEFAEAACESYTSWANGDCYGIVIGIYDLEGNLIEDPTCWGYVGSEWAEEALEEEFESWVKHLAKESPK